LRCSVDFQGPVVFDEGGTAALAACPQNRRITGRLHHWRNTTAQHFTGEANGGGLTTNDNINSNGRAGQLWVNMPAPGSPRPDEALTSYRASLAVAERLVAFDSHNALWQMNLVVAQDGFADIRVLHGKLDEALERYRASLVIRERLAAADDRNRRTAGRGGNSRQDRQRAARSR
jgi:hypothetical protein